MRYAGQEHTVRVPVGGRRRARARSSAASTTCTSSSTPSGSPPRSSSSTSASPGSARCRSPSCAALAARRRRGGRVEGLARRRLRRARPARGAGLRARAARRRARSSRGPPSSRSPPPRPSSSPASGCAWTSFGEPDRRHDARSRADGHRTGTRPRSLHRRDPQGLADRDRRRDVRRAPADLAEPDHLRGARLRLGADRRRGAADHAGERRHRLHRDAARRP